MYVSVKVGKRGEIVIPSIIRKKFNIQSGQELGLDVDEQTIRVIPKRADVMDWIRQFAKKHAIPEDQLVHGSKLYEEVFGSE